MASLSSVKKIFRSLNKDKIQYCHWKSNFQLDEGLKGHTDLDLLVAREHCVPFKKILYEHGCKSIKPPTDKDSPAIEHYLGYDEKTGSLFHLHIYYQLVFGGRYDKRYRLPLEQKFLTSTKTKQGVKIVTPDIDLIIRVIRAVLKYKYRDLIKDAFLFGSPGLDKKTLREFDYLLAQTTVDEIEKALVSKFTLVTPEIIREFLNIVTESPRAAYKLHKLKRRLKRELRPYQRISRFKAAYEHFMAFLVRKLPFLRSLLRPKKKPEAGGMLIALVGVDGAGKSTVARELQRWLSWKLQVRICYLGDGKKSLLNRTLQMNYRIFRRLKQVSKKFVGDGQLTRMIDMIHWFNRDIYYIAIALRRYRNYKNSLKEASTGSVVLCDRYPLAAVNEEMKDSDFPPMDGWRSAWMLRRQNLNSIDEYLSKVEQGIYKKNFPPDYFFRLCVDAKTALDRKPDHSEKEVNAKIQAIAAISPNGLNVIDIDTNQTFEKTFTEFKNAVWNILCDQLTTA